MQFLVEIVLVMLVGEILGFIQRNDNLVLTVHQDSSARALLEASFDQLTFPWSIYFIIVFIDIINKNFCLLHLDVLIFRLLCLKKVIHPLVSSLKNFIQKWSISINIGRRTLVGHFKIYLKSWFWAFRIEIPVPSIKKERNWLISRCTHQFWQGWWRSPYFP